MTKEEYRLYLDCVFSSSAGIIEGFIDHKASTLRELTIVTLGAIAGKTSQIVLPDGLEQDLKKIKEQLKGNNDES